MTPLRSFCAPALLVALAACGTPLDPPGTPLDTAVDTGGADGGSGGDGGNGSGDDGGNGSGGDDGDDTVIPDEDGDFLFGDQTLRLDITLSDAAIAALSAAPREEVEATLGFQGEEWRAGVRLKGSTSFRDLTEKASFKVDVHAFDEEQRFYGFKRLTLNNMIQDPTMSSEHLSYRLHGLLGHPAPRHGYANVYVNGERFGLYTLVETVDEQFIDRHFPDDDDGVLFEGGYGGDFNEGCAPLFQLQEGDEANVGVLQALIDDVEASTPDTFPAVLAAHFDTDALLDVWAVEIVSSNDDAYTTLGNNFYVYYAPLAARWALIPWGTDQAFQGDEPFPTELGGALAERCLASPACASALDARIDHLLGVWDDAGFADWATAEADRIESDCRTDPRSDWGDYGCRDALAALRDWVAARPAVVRSR